MPKETIELAEMIESLRHELWKAERSGRDQPIRFDVGEVELEAQVTMAFNGEGKLTAKVIVWDAEVKGAVSREKVHTVRIKLHPVRTTKDGADRKVRLAAKGQKKGKA